VINNSKFEALPLVIEGESKEVRYLGRGKVAIRLKPTIYSYTHNRYSVIPGSETLRLRACKVLVNVLKYAGISHAYECIEGNLIVAKLLLPTEDELAKYKTKQFVPRDLSSEEIGMLLRAPPIEVIIKHNLSGTTPKTCHYLAGSRVRGSHPRNAGDRLYLDRRLPHRIVRFDWRNPLRSTEQGKLAADAILARFGREDTHLRSVIEEYCSRVPDVPFSDLADWKIDVAAARETAHHTVDALEAFLGSKGISIYDLCLFIDELGTTVFGEISPDCGRFRDRDENSLDKDVWRAGGSSEDVLRKWNLFCERIGA
jgi:phosphoribosylaminoimidazole-succinocarboxamide synthase